MSPNTSEPYENHNQTDGTPNNNSRCTILCIHDERKSIRQTIKEVSFLQNQMKRTPLQKGEKKISSLTKYTHALTWLGSTQFDKPHITHTH